MTWGPVGPPLGVPALPSVRKGSLHARVGMEPLLKPQGTHRLLPALGCCSSIPKSVTESTHYFNLKARSCVTL